MLRGIVEKNVYRCKWFNICKKIGVITRGRLATSVDFVHCHVALWNLDWTAWMSEEKNDFFTFHAKISDRCVATATNCRSASTKEEKFTNRAPIFNLSANIFYLYEKKARQDHSRASLIARGPISTFQQTFITGRWMEEIRACIFFFFDASHVPCGEEGEREAGSKQNEIINQTLCTESWRDILVLIAHCQSEMLQHILEYSLSVLHSLEYFFIMYAVCWMPSLYAFAFAMYTRRAHEEEGWKECRVSEYEEKQIWGIRSSPRALIFSWKVPSTSMTTKNDDGSILEEMPCWRWRRRRRREAERIGNAVQIPLIHGATRRSYSTSCVHVPY